MNTLKDFIVDNLNGFAFSHIPLFIFQLLMAGILAFCFQFLYNKKFKKSLIQNSVFSAVLVAFLVSLVKGTLSFSVLGAAVILLYFKSKEQSRLSLLGHLAILTISIGCGIGSVIQTLIGFIIISLVLIFTPLNDQNA